jgi:2-methylcitrate dehydratase PrpD
MKRLLIDYLGVALAGSQSDSSKIAGAVMAGFGGSPQCTVIGQGKRLPAPSAAFVNAISEHSIEMDDVDEEAMFHFGPPIVSATLAVAEAVSANGEQFLRALHAGCEITSRLSLACNPALRNRGFHTTATCGTFGATVAGGVLLGLTADQMTSALGLAGAQAAGVMEYFGTSMQKRFNPGPAARSGVTAAYMAQAGFTGADTIVEGERGFALTHAGSIDVDTLLRDLGKSAPIVIEYKPYASARPIHNAIDCALEIRRQGVDITKIESVLVRRHPSWASYHQMTEPRTFHEAQVSLPYSVAVAFEDGVALPEQYAEQRVTGSPSTRALSKLVKVEEDPSLLRGVSCHMIVLTTDGRSFSATVDYPLGSAQNPLDDDSLIAKFERLSGPLLPAESRKGVVKAVFNIQDLDDVGELLKSVI